MLYVFAHHESEKENVIYVDYLVAYLDKAKIHTVKRASDYYS